MVKLNVNLLHCTARFGLSLIRLAFQLSYIPDYMSYAAKCVTQLENTIVDSSTMTASEKLTASNPKWFKNLCTFGEIGITYNNQKIKGKLDNRGYPCMFIGYTEDHASNVYVFFNLNNQAIFMSRNVVWLHKLFHQHMKTNSRNQYL
jgi:hypothetical protein